MAKAAIHPDWYPNAKVYCDGQLVMKVGSTKPSLNVDIWSTNTSESPVCEYHVSK